MKKVVIFGILLCSLSSANIFGAQESAFYQLEKFRCNQYFKGDICLKLVQEYDPKITAQEKERDQKINEVKKKYEDKEKPVQEKINQCDKLYADNAQLRASCLQVAKKELSDLRLNMKDEILALVKKYNEIIDDLKKKFEKQWMTEYLEVKKRIEPITKK